MSALKQYIDLYEAHSELVNEYGSPALNSLRKKALDILLHTRLPKKGSENFDNIDLNDILAPDYGINLQRIAPDVNTDLTFRCDLPVSRQSVLMNMNDTFTASDDAYDNLPDGVDVGSLAEFAKFNPEIVEKYYGRVADMNNPIVALNTLFAQDGLYLHVRKGTRLEKPLQLVNILSSARPLMAVRRLLIVIEEDAEAKLLVCDHSQNDDTDLLSLETVEISVGEHSRFDYYHIEESSKSTKRLSALYLNQQASSTVTVDGITLFNGVTRNEYYTRFEGEGASLKLYGMGIEDDNRVISTFSHIDHRVPECKSDELFKFTIDDHASGDFTGRIHVAEGASKTEAYQSNRNLVGSATAKMNSKPQLEIYNDDVKCSHGCAIGQLDPMQVFYMRTRGISEATAKLLLRQAFMSDVIDAIDVQALRDRLHILTERRFAGLQSACGNCRHCDRKQL
ncbi:MAG: Fe-S cluster assembly protein SufD [Bacteroidales bacterium]|nr:Fe-S cluster assembly protein SufD [Bacteroidales bacterium]MBD5302774.1 Fe-S cluster assembly protein SufD [Bacteroides sp.]